MLIRESNRRWKIRWTNEAETSQYIENKLYRKASSNPSLSAAYIVNPLLSKGFAVFIWGGGGAGMGADYVTRSDFERVSFTVPPGKFLLTSVGADISG